MSIFLHTFSKMLGFLLAIFFFILVIIFFLNFFNPNKNSYFSHFSENENSSEIVAILELNGPIISEPKNLYNFSIFNDLEAIYPSLVENYLNELREREIKGLIVSINSPGGGVSASQKIYSLFKEFKIDNNIPIYFHTTNLLASGGYWIALSGDKIFADYGSIIGSIGVKGPNWIYYNEPTAISSGLLGNSVESPQGIKLFSNTAGIYKDIFNPFRKPTNQEMLKLQENINDIYIDFVNLVSKSRKIEKLTIINDIGAMIYSSKKAEENFLINKEKNLKESVNYLKNELKLSSISLIKNNINNDNYNILKMSIYKFLNSPEKMGLNNNIIDQKVCNNFLNEISSISFISMNLKC